VITPNGLGSGRRSELDCEVVRRNYLAELEPLRDEPAVTPYPPRMPSGEQALQGSGVRYSPQIMSPEARIPRRGLADYPQRQVLSAIWPSSNPEQLTKQYEAALAGMAGIGPGDEIEGMLAAQMVATHSAAMECYRRAMLDNQTFEGRRESLSQASKLTFSGSAVRRFIVVPHWCAY